MIFSKDIINLPKYSVEHYSFIILRTIQSENKTGTVNMYYVKAHIWEIRVLVFGVSAKWKPTLNIDAKSVVVVILMVKFSY